MRNGRRMVVRRIWAPQGDSCREHSQCRACSSEAQPAGKATAGSDPEQLPKHSQASCSLAATRPQTNPDINPRAAALTPKAQRGQLCTLGILPACLGGSSSPHPCSHSSQGLLQAQDPALMLQALEAGTGDAESQATSGCLCLQIGSSGYCLWQSLSTITLSALLCLIWAGLAFA